jgi:metastasis-associated protein MTA
MIRPEEDTRVESDLEELVWSPHHPLADKAIDQFLVLARSVGTFARAVDAASTLKQPR